MKREDEQHFAGDHIYEGNKKEPYLRAISQLLIGLFFAGAGLFQFFRIQKWEAAGGTIEMNKVQELLYRFAGKWGILAFLLLLGAVFMYRAYARWKRIKAQERL
jgi:hypothetical protein